MSESEGYAVIEPGVAMKIVDHPDHTLPPVVAGATPIDCTVVGAAPTTPGELGGKLWTVQTPAGRVVVHEDQLARRGGDSVEVEQVWESSIAPGYRLRIVRPLDDGRWLAERVDMPPASASGLQLGETTPVSEGQLQSGFALADPDEDPYRAYRERAEER